MDYIEYIWKWVWTASTLPFRIIEIVVLLITLAGLAIGQIRPGWVGKYKKLAWQLPFGLLVVVFVFSLATSSFRLYEEKIDEISTLNQELEAARKMAYPPLTTLMMSPCFKDLDIPLGEFGLVNQLLADKTFDNCRIHGPIVLYVITGSILSCIFNGDRESMFIVTSNQRVDGVLGIQDCTFVNCTFDKVSFIGPQDQIDQLKQGFTFK